MSDVKWIKIVTDIFDDEKIMLIESLPEADSIIVIWFKLLCLAGKQNNSGVFQINGRIPYTEEMFATIFRRKINTVRMALHTFEQYGMIEIINNTVTIPNWGKHQSIEQIEARREYQRNYQRQYYAKQKALAEGKNSKRLEKRLDEGLDKQNLNRVDKNREDKKREEQLQQQEVAAVDTVQAYASSNLQHMSPGNIQDMMGFMEDLPEDLIRFAIDEACGKGAPRWAYVSSILSSFLRDGIKTVGDAKAAKAKRQAMNQPDTHEEPVLTLREQLRRGGYYADDE